MMATNQETTAQKRGDIPTPTDINLSRSALTIKAQCRDCIHFKRIAYPAYKQVCSNLGITEDMKPCDNFDVNPASIRFSESKNIQRVAQACEELSETKLKLLAVLLNQSQRTRKQDLKFGQVVFFRLFGGDYVTNYAVARVLYATNKLVHIQGVDGCIASLHRSSVLNARQWERKEFELLKTNKIRDPQASRFMRVPSKAQIELQKMEKPLPLDFSEKLAKKAANNNTLNDKIILERRTSVDKLLANRFMQVR